MAGRPPKNTPANKLKAELKSIAKQEDMYCTHCGKFKKPEDFYKSSTTLNIHFGRMTVCINCIVKMYDDLFAINDSHKKSIYIMCSELNIPYVENAAIASIDGKAHTIRGYITKINSLPQYKGMNFRDSDKFEDDKFTDETVELISTDDISIKEMKIRWGTTYDKDTLIRFEEKYRFLKNNYKEKTNMHTEALLKYVRYSVLEEMATEDGDLAKAKGWGDMAQKAATSAKINPNQLTKADLSDGLNTIGELAQAIEREVDIVPILPKFKYRPNDALDFNIFCYVNYERHLRGMPLVEYSDVYKFYDDRVEDYKKQYGDPYGLFENDTTKKNRRNIETFLSDEEDFVENETEIQDDMED